MAGNHRAWQFGAFGDIHQVLELREVPTPSPGQQECLVRTRALALNFPDILMVEGKYQMKPDLPAIPGMEAMGVVERAGPGSRFREGQRVVAMQLFGCFAEALVAPDAMLLAVPDSMSDADAAAFQAAYQTSWFGLTHRGQLEPGEWLLVHGAAGGVGSAAVQLGKALGARVIATVGGPKKVEVAKRCGADVVVDTRTQDFVQVVKEVTDGHGADVIYDPVGGDTFDRSTRLVAFEGRIVVIGFTSGVIPTISVNRLLLKTAAVVGLQWGAYKMFAPEKVDAAHLELVKLYEAGRIKPTLYERTFAFEDLLPALETLRTRQAFGKVIVSVP